MQVFVPIRATHPWKQSATNLSFYLPQAKDRMRFAGSILLKAACVCFNFFLVWVQPLKERVPLHNSVSLFQNKRRLQRQLLALLARASAALFTNTPEEQKQAEES